MKILKVITSIPFWFSAGCFLIAFTTIALFAPELFLPFFAVGMGMVTILVLIDLLFSSDWIKPEDPKKQWTEDEL